MYCTVQKNRTNHHVIGKREAQDLPDDPDDKRIMKRLLLIVSLLCSTAIYAQEIKQEFVRDTLEVYFRQSHSTYDPTYMENQVRMDQFIERIKAIEGSTDKTILEVDYSAGASPEGSFRFNQQLAQNRANSISNYLHDHVVFGRNAHEVLLASEDYVELKRLVEASTMPYRDEVLALLKDVDGSKISEAESTTLKQQLRKLRGGEPWRYMYRHFFPQLRHFTVMVVIGIDIPEDMHYEQPLALTAPLPQMPISHALLQRPEEVIVEEECPREWLLKTNAIGWGMLVPNGAIEYKFNCHWSFNLPIYWSGLDYFNHKTKFRMFGVYPEMRYWFGKQDGLFVGAHLALVYFNYAVHGSYRIQDHDKDTPAWGGGLNIGYRMPISKNNRWKMEFSAGCGVYDVHYDKFYNEKNGLRAVIDTHKTMFKLDNVAVNLTYSFYPKKHKK